MTGERREKARLKTARGRDVGSTRWLERQLNDPYVQRAKRDGWRARSVYKLEEIDTRFGLLAKGRAVVDLGAAPGSWSQYAAKRGCRVVGIDLLAMEPIEGVILREGDFLEAAEQDAIRAELGGQADVVLSDMAANSTGQRAVDRLRASGLGEAVLAFAAEVLAPEGACLIKLVRGAEAIVRTEAAGLFRQVHLLRPAATRKESSEIYLLGLGFRKAAGAAGDDGPLSPAA